MSKFKDVNVSPADEKKGFGLSEPEPTRAAVIVPILPERYNNSTASEEGERTQFQRSNEARLEEAIGLARAINLDIAHAENVTVSQPRPATLLGTGKIK